MTKTGTYTATVTVNAPSSGSSNFLNVEWCDQTNSYCSNIGCRCGYDSVVVTTGDPPPQIVVKKAEAFPSAIPSTVPTPFAEVSMEPAIDSGDLTVWLAGQPLQATPAPGDEPPVLATATPPIFTGSKSGNDYQLGFSFLNYTQLPLGRYLKVGASWVVNGVTNAAQKVKFACDNLSNDILNYQLDMSSPADALAKLLSNTISDTMPIIVYSPGSNPTDNPAQNYYVPAEAYIGNTSGAKPLYPNDGLIFWWNTDANRTGQQPGQILFHELDHHWYEGLNLARDCRIAQAPCVASLTAVINGASQTLVWDIRANVDSQSQKTVSQAYLDFEHILIHDDLVVSYATDVTGALAEGFGPGILPSPPSPAPSYQSTQVYGLLTSAGFVDIGGPVAAGQVVTITVNGQSSSYTETSTSTLSSVGDALVAEINGNTNLNTLVKSLDHSSPIAGFYSVYIAALNTAANSLSLSATSTGQAVVVASGTKLGLPPHVAPVLTPTPSCTSGAILPFHARYKESPDLRPRAVP